MDTVRQNFGEYDVHEEVGRGAMGVVYRAIDRKIGREVALKTIKTNEMGEGPQRAHLQERLRREARAAGILNHPRIVTIYGFHELEDVTYIVMEFVNGPTLTQKLEEIGHIPAPQVGSIILGAAQGLDYAHSRGVVHRDIKPANLMITEEGFVKITDFGVAKIFKDPGMTQVGTMMGTPFYMAPEQIMGATATGAADQFALALIAYELLEGKKPFDSESLPGLIHKILTQPVPPCERLAKDSGEAVCSVLGKALSKKPEERYGSCVEFANALVIALEGKIPGTKTLELKTRGLDANIAAPDPNHTLGLRAFTSKPALGASALVALLLIALVIYYTRKPENHDNATTTSHIESSISKPIIETRHQDTNPPPITNTHVQDTTPVVVQNGKKPVQDTKLKEIPHYSAITPVTPPVVTVDPPPTPHQDNPPVVKVDPPVDPPPSIGEYGNRRKGEFTWFGSLAPGAELKIALSRVAAGGGQLQTDGSFLKGGKPVEVAVSAPGVTIVDAPSDANRWTSILVRNTSAAPVSEITFTWRLRN